MWQNSIHRWTILRDNHSLSRRKGALRGLRYQLKLHAKGKLVCMLSQEKYLMSLLIFECGYPTCLESGSLLSSHPRVITYIVNLFDFDACQDHGRIDYILGVPPTLGYDVYVKEKCEDRL